MALAEDLVIGGEENEDIVRADADADVDAGEVEEGEEGEVEDENVDAIREDQGEDHLKDEGGHSRVANVKPAGGYQVAVMRA